MTAFIIFLCVVVLVWGFLGYWAAYWKGYDKASEDHWPEACEAQLDEQWGWLKKANARRKRFERVLRRERAKHELIQHNMIVRHGQVLGELEQAHEDLDQLEERYKTLAAQAVEGLLAHEEKQIRSLIFKENT